MTSALIVLLLGVMLVACSGGSDSESDSSGAVDKGAGERAPATSGTRQAEGGDEESGDGEKPQARLPAAREVVHIAKLRVRAGNVDGSATKAKQLVIAAGGYVERESSSSAPARSEIDLKIPNDKYNDLLNKLSTQLGAKLSLTQETEDVTGEVADVEARVRSAEATLTSFRKLLERANSVSEIIDIEDEIAERESDLEALQAREKSLKSRTAFATVTVTLEAKPAPVEKKKEDDSPGGFVGGLQSGWSAFTTFIGGLAVLLGWLLPFLVTAAVLGLPVLAFRHRLRDRFWNGSGPLSGARTSRPEPEKAAAGTGPEPPRGRQGPPPGPQGPAPPS